MSSNKPLIVMIIFMVMFVFGVFFKKQIELFFKKPEIKVEHKAFRVAILVPIVHPSIEEIRTGFIDTLNKSVACMYDDYNANGNRTLLRNQAEEIAMKKYDLIFTIATGPALIMKEVCEQRQSNTPIVAGAVDNPVGVQLVSSMESSGNNVVAVTGTDSFDEQIELLKFLKPSLKSILLVYSPGSGLDQKKEAVAQICRDNGIDFGSVEVFSINDIIQKVPSVMNRYDTVMVLKDNVVVSGIESLINVCNRTHKTLYASDLNSGDKGAALSYGVSEYNDGVEAAYKAVEILKNGKNPSELSSYVCNDFKIKVNTQTMEDQDVHIDKRLLKLIKSGETV